MTSRLEQLSVESLYNIVLNLRPYQILQLCQTSSYFYQNICLNAKYLWIDLYRKWISEVNYFDIQPDQARDEFIRIYTLLRGKEIYDAIYFAAVNGADKIVKSIFQATDANPSVLLAGPIFGHPVDSKTLLLQNALLGAVSGGYMNIVELVVQRILTFKTSTNYAIITNSLRRAHFLRNYRIRDRLIRALQEYGFSNDQINELVEVHLDSEEYD